LPKSAGGWIEGSELGPQDRVLLTDDVADTGRSLIDAYHRISSTGAKVAGVMPMVERGDQAGPQFAKLGVPYHPLMHYNDLGINTLSNPPAAP
jgi:orotate phosphoribosyltransferase